MAKSSPILQRLRKLSIIDPATSCWQWQGSLDRDGYGRITYKGRQGSLAHRVSYEVHVGAVPLGMDVDHKCDNRSCINPQHLRPSTHRANILRSNNAAAINARKTTCIRGHRFDAENTHIVGSRRRCRACSRLRNSKQYRRRKAIQTIGRAA